MNILKSTSNVASSDHIPTGTNAVVSSSVEKFVEDFQSSVDVVQLAHDEDLDRLNTHDRGSLTHHNDSYDSILYNYTDHVSQTLKTKRFMKKFFFWVSLSVMMLITILVFVCILVTCLNAGNSNFDAQNYIIPGVSALASFLTTFIVVPKIIAEYLFNSNEDSVMREIVSSIQEYDKYVRHFLKGNTQNNRPRK